MATLMEGVQKLTENLLQVERTRARREVNNPFLNFASKIVEKQMNLDVETNNTLTQPIIIDKINQTFKTLTVTRVKVHYI